MRRLRDIYPQFADEVDLFVVNIDRFEELVDTGGPWQDAEPLGRMLVDLNVRTQSTKIAVDAQGIITYRQGYGRGDPMTWRRVFTELSSEALQ